MSVAIAVIQLLSVLCFLVSLVCVVGWLVLGGPSR